MTFIKKHWVLFTTLLFIFFMGFPPIFYFTFMTWEYPKLYMEDNPWIGFIGGYFGAIFGGVISGLFTFLGARYTIKTTEKADFLSKYFKHKLVLDESIRKLQKDFINAQHLTTVEAKVIFLINSLPLLKGVIDEINKEIGGNLARKLSYFFMFHEKIELKSRSNLKHTSKEELADTHFDYIFAMIKELENYSEKLDEKYRTYRK